MKMKKLMYLFVVVTMFAFTFCGGVETETATEDVIIACADDCQKACCLGCKATEGAAKCIVLADGSMPCCVSDEVSSEEEAYDNDESHGHEH